METPKDANDTLRGWLDTILTSEKIHNGPLHIALTTGSVCKSIVNSYPDVCATGLNIGKVSVGPVVFSSACPSTCKQAAMLHAAGDTRTLRQLLPNLIPREKLQDFHLNYISPEENPAKRYLDLGALSMKKITASCLSPCLINGVENGTKAAHCYTTPLTSDLMELGQRVCSAADKENNIFMGVAHSKGSNAWNEFKNSKKPLSEFLRLELGIGPSIVLGILGCPGLNQEERVRTAIHIGMFANLASSQLLTLREAFTRPEFINMWKTLLVSFGKSAVDFITSDVLEAEYKKKMFPEVEVESLDEFVNKHIIQGKAAMVKLADQTKSNLAASY
jgi:hypothetical protein